MRTLLGRERKLPDACQRGAAQGHALRAAINTPIQGSAADVATAAMLAIARNERLRELGWTMLLQARACADLSCFVPEPEGLQQLYLMQRVPVQACLDAAAGRCFSVSWASALACSQLACTRPCQAHRAHWLGYLLSAFKNN